MIGAAVLELCGGNIDDSLPGPVGNDCLNLNCFSEHPGESFQTFGPSEGPVAESVFIAGMFVKYGEEYAQLCELMGDAQEAAYARAQAAEMYDTILSSGWDGEWFVRAYDAYVPSGHHLGIHIGLGAVDLTDIFHIGGTGLFIDLKGNRGHQRLCA